MIVCGKGKNIMIFIFGMMCGSFCSVFLLLFFQGAYKSDKAWKEECDEEFLKQMNQKK